jgi:hypothetical protein
MHVGEQIHVLSLSAFGSHCSPVLSTPLPQVQAVPVSPLGHWHAPPTQTMFEEQAFEQPPQLLASVEVLTQAVLLQNVSPALHWHTPPTQCRPPVHTMPQVPQLFGSPAKLTQPLGQDWG